MCSREVPGNDTLMLYQVHSTPCLHVLLLSRRHGSLATNVIGYRNIHVGYVLVGRDNLPV